MTYIQQHYRLYKTALEKRSPWLKKLFELSFLFFLIKGIVWLAIFSGLAFLNTF